MYTSVFTDYYPVLGAAWGARLVSEGISLINTSSIFEELHGNLFPTQFVNLIYL